MKTVKKIVLVILLVGAEAYAGKLFFGRSTVLPAPVPAYFSQSGASDSTGMAAGTVTGRIISVKSGSSIQEAVGEAKPVDFF